MGMIISRPTNIGLGCKMICNYKHSSLFCRRVDEEKFNASATLSSMLSIKVGILSKFSETFFLRQKLFFSQRRVLFQEPPAPGFIPGLLKINKSQKLWWHK
jgi:hypothetical protein